MGSPCVGTAGGAGCIATPALSPCGCPCHASLDPHLPPVLGDRTSWASYQEEAPSHGNSPESKLVKRPRIPKLSQASGEEHWDAFSSSSVHLQAKCASVTGKL
ncbi:uncharacterized protein [Macaca fascicularis]|uniref:uncharacterized protein n=1 Tax=Macaca fascicularis TaxID=9541 RepID=UPI0032B04D03